MPFSPRNRESGLLKKKPITRIGEQGRNNLENIIQLSDRVTEIEEQLQAILWWIKKEYGNKHEIFQYLEKKVNSREKGSLSVRVRSANTIAPRPTNTRRGIAEVTGATYYKDKLSLDLFDVSHIPSLNPRVVISHEDYLKCQFGNAAFTSDFTNNEEHQRQSDLNQQVRQRKQSLEPKTYASLDYSDGLPSPVRTALCEENNQAEDDNSDPTYYPSSSDEDQDLVSVPNERIEVIHFPVKTEPDDVSEAKNNDLMDELLLLQCHDCDKQFTSHESLVKHTSIHETLRILRNEYSSESASTTSYLSIPIPILVQEGDSSINVTEENTQPPKPGIVDYLRGKQRQRKFVARSTAQSTSCPICNTWFRTKREFMKHRATVHRGQHTKYKKKKELCIRSTAKSVTCPVCSEDFRTTREYIKHRATAHPRQHIKQPSSSSTSSQKYPCPICGKVYAKSIHLNAHHRIIHIGIKEHLCTICGKRFGRKTMLVDHMKIHSDYYGYECKYCDKKFKQKQGWFVHNQRHLGNARKQQCALCGQILNSAYNLKKHLELVHQKIRKFACPICNKKFKTKTSLNYHVKTHSNPNSKKRGLNRDQLEPGDNYRVKRLGGFFRVPCVQVSNAEDGNWNVTTGAGTEINEKNENEDSKPNKGKMYSEFEGYENAPTTNSMDLVSALNDVNVVLNPHFSVNE